VADAAGSNECGYFSPALTKKTMMTPLQHQLFIVSVIL